MAVESDVTRWASPHEIPSLVFIYSTDTRHLVHVLVRIHDDDSVDRWEQELTDVAIKYGLQPFGRCDLSGRRGQVNPLALWYTDKEQRQKLQEVHALAGTSHLLEDYLKAWPVNA